MREDKKIDMRRNCTSLRLWTKFPPSFLPQRTLRAQSFFKGFYLSVLCVTSTSSVQAFVVKGVLLAAFILERNLDLGAVRGDLAVVQHYVQLADFGDAQIAQGLRRALHSHARRFLPRFRTRADQLDDLVYA